MCFLLMTYVLVQELCVTVYLSIRMHTLYGFWLKDVYIHTQGVSFCIGGAAPHHSLYGWILGACGSSVECHLLFSLVSTICVLLYGNKINTRMLVTIGICFKSYFDTRHFAFCNLSPSRMFLSLDLLPEYRIQHTIGLLYVTSIYWTIIFYRGVSGFATDCPCGVWCRGLTLASCMLVHFSDMYF